MEKAGGRQRRRLSGDIGPLLALALALACLVSAVALASVGHEFEKSFGPDGTSGSEFEFAGPLGIDQETHNVYVADRGPGTVSKFDENGTPVEFTAGPGAGTNDLPGFSFIGEGANQIAVDSASHNFYVAELPSRIKAYEQTGAPFEFTAGPGSGTNEIPGFTEVAGVAVDADGAIYVSDSGTKEVHVFAPSGEEIVSFETTVAPFNLAIDSSGDVYVAPFHFFGAAVQKWSPSAFPVTPTTTYALTDEPDPKPAFTLAVDSANDDLYVDEGTRIAQFEEDGTPVGTFPPESGPEALTESEGLAVDGETERVFVSDLKGKHQVEIFGPPPPIPPSVGATSVTNITINSADLHAQVNPNFFATKYRFQYVTQAQFELTGFTGATETPEGNLGSAGQTQTANAHIGNLTPDTTYRFRVLAKNENGETASAEPAQSFHTFALFPSDLPDGRAYEMVSPPQKVGEVFPPEPSGSLGASCLECLPGINDQMMPMQSTPDGSAMVYTGQPFSANLAAGPNEYLANRAMGGWGTEPLSSPLFSKGFGQGYVAFSSDLSRGVLLQIEPALSLEAPTEGGKSFANLYLREGNLLRPLVAEEPEHRDAGVPVQNGNQFRVAYAGASSVPAFEHLIFEANDALTDAVLGIAPAAPEIEAGKVGDECGFSEANCNLYEWVDGEQLRLVNVLPGNASASSAAVIGSGGLLRSSQFDARNVDHAISSDGSRIFWSDEETGQVYVRVDGEETLEIPGPGLCKKSVELQNRACFLTASADGGGVLLSDGELFGLNEETEAYELSADLTEGQGGFQGILGTSEDLSHVYFVDTKALTPEGEENDNEEHAEAGKFNLYAWVQGEMTFIGVLHPTDNDTTGLGFGDWKASRSNRTAQVTPDGRYLAFMSKSTLTGYDSRISDGVDCGTVAPDAAICDEVFEYAANLGTTTCASCNPTGQRPLGVSSLSLIRPKSGFPPLPQPANLSPAGEGRLFFVTQDSLSPSDTNEGISDVYEWEPNGVGSCQRPGGCIFLISSGRSSNDSLFVNATPSGDDAFFVTREKLLPRDKDDLIDLYDARAPHAPGEAVGFPENVTPPCTAETCKAPLSSPPPALGTESRNFSGPGNPPKQPNKHKKKQHKKKQHKKKQHKKKQHKRSAKRNRGGSK
jgi:hypothetical protein